MKTIILHTLYFHKHVYHPAICNFCTKNDSSASRWGVKISQCAFLQRCAACQYFREAFTSHSISIFITPFEAQPSFCQAFLRDFPGLFVAASPNLLKHCSTNSFYTDLANHFLHQAQFSAFYFPKRTQNLLFLYNHTGCFFVVLKEQNRQISVPAESSRGGLP